MGGAAGESDGDHDDGSGFGGLGGLGGLFGGMGGGRGAHGFGGMGGGVKRAREPRKDPPVTRELPLTLEEMYNGCTKKLKITRKVGRRMRAPQRHSNTVFCNTPCGTAFADRCA